MSYLEPNISERIEEAKELAYRVYKGEAENEEDSDKILVSFLRFRLSRLLGKGYFDEYFDKRTLDDLVFELELLRLERTESTSNVDQGSEMLNNNKKETESLFDDWVDTDKDVDESQFQEDAKKFMETGDFK